jgi:hypothetical protein
MLTHKPGKQNILADKLSRLPSTKVHNSEDNWGVTMLKLEFFCTATIEVLCSWDDLEEAVWSCKNLEPLVQTALDQVCKKGSQKLPNGRLKWEEKDSLIYHQGRLYVPNWDNLCQAVTVLLYAPVPLSHIQTPPASGTAFIALTSSFHHNSMLPCTSPKVSPTLDKLWSFYASTSYYTCAPTHQRKHPYLPWHAYACASGHVHDLFFF